MNAKRFVIISLIFSVGFMKLAPHAMSQGGAIPVGVGVSIGIAVLTQVKSALKESGTAIAYAKSKVAGADADDRGVSFEFDKDQGLDWSLDAVTQVVFGNNNVDNGEETPYSKGEAHEAFIELHFDSVDGEWQPDPSDCLHCENENNEFDGYVEAHPEDDPTKKNQKTEAGAAAGFSADGKTVDFCYQAGSENNSGKTRIVNPKLVECSPIPELSLVHASAFLISVERFQFIEMSGGKVMIEPLFGPVIDLFHTYLQKGDSTSIFPLLRGHDELIQELKSDAYADRIEGTNFLLINNPTKKADLSIVGAALQVSSYEIDRSGRSDRQLLEAYFASNAVQVVAPQYAQEGYIPQVELQALIHSGDNISSMVDRPFTIPVNGNPSASIEDDPTIGLLIRVKGDIDAAVSLALNTPGHFVRALALEALGITDGGVSSGLGVFDSNGDKVFNDEEVLEAIRAWIRGEVDDATAREAVRLWITGGEIPQTVASVSAEPLQQNSSIEFRIPSMNFHFEIPSSMSDIAVASPQENIEGWNPPMIEDVVYEETVPLNGIGEMTLFYSDKDADLDYALITSSNSGDIMHAPSDGPGLTNGVIYLTQPCGPTPGPVSLTIVLIDSHDHQSDPWFIEYFCEESEIAEQLLIDLTSTNMGYPNSEVRVAGVVTNGISPFSVNIDHAWGNANLATFVEGFEFFVFIPPDATLGLHPFTITATDTQGKEGSFQGAINVVLPEEG